MKKQAIDNQLGSLSCYPQTHPLAVQRLQQEAELTDRQIADICQRIERELPPRPEADD